MLLLRTFAIVLLVSTASVLAQHYLSVTDFVRVRVGTDQQFDVKSYGAKGDGKTDDTHAIQDAFDACAKAGGGTVIFPAGNNFLTFPFHFSGTGTNMYVEDGCTIQANPDRGKWPDNTPFISARNMQHLAITGYGEINGNGDTWWPHTSDFRPGMLVFEGTSFVLFTGVHFVNSANHNLEMDSDQTEIANVTITAPQNSPNTDGIDVHGSPFYIHDCHIAVGDDNVAQHSNDTLVENCFFGTGHGASIGSVCDSWIQNVTFRNILFDGTDQAVRIKTDQGCAGAIHNITYSNLNAKNVGSTIIVTMFYQTSKHQTTMQISNIVLENITSDHAKAPGSFLCDDQSPCKDIQMNNVQHKNPSVGEMSGFEWQCKNAFGTAHDVSPSSCLHS
eukprot:TRINITY_DN5590_c0_g1_i2.p1 TRINITY_DN5590_c0_g1~~TRINITY_DN5590_c0_g1_i2.p1  ORF type:complete len:389 (-),score=90.01 TRINITY_DN5590_c0_g1_i2:883-2049(-)